MLFNSWQFLLFFPVVTGVYFALPYRPRMWALLLASALFYMAFIPEYVLILLSLIAVDFAAGLLIGRSAAGRRKAWLLLSLAANLGALALFKYYGFFVENVSALLAAAGASWAPPLVALALPVGLSFHTFQAMSYTIEVYRGRQEPERDLLLFSLYVMFYPQLVAGPIERPRSLLSQLRMDHRFDYDRVASGLRLMLWGFCKKVFVADQLAVLVNQVYARPGEHGGWALLLATYAFAFQIYCDFSGYSDIARGSARVMGISLMRNFDHPYAATSFKDFWSRWHISLSTWFRDYLYVPLGGGRLGAARTALNLTIVFLISGLWHGAGWTFVVWGALHAAFVIAERAFAAPWARVPRAIRSFFVFQLVSFAWIFFRSPTLTDAGTVISGIASLAPSLELDRLGLEPRDLLLAFGGAFALWGAERLNRDGRIERAFLRLPGFVRWACYSVSAYLLLFMGRLSQREFVYFQF